MLHDELIFHLIQKWTELVITYTHHRGQDAWLRGCSLPSWQQWVWPWSLILKAKIMFSLYVKPDLNMTQPPHNTETLNKGLVRDIWSSQVLRSDCTQNPVCMCTLRPAVFQIRQTAVKHLSRCVCADTAGPVLFPLSEEMRHGTPLSSSLYLSQPSALPDSLTSCRENATHSM